MESSTTNIADLPKIQLNSACQKGTQKVRDDQVVLETNEMTPPLPPLLTPEQMEQLTKQIQSISNNGGTELPSRDIPMQTNHIVQDAQVKPNYVPEPPPEKRDYIKENEIKERVMREEIRKQYENRSKGDKFYEDLQGPIFAMVLFFLFQMPIVKITMKKYVPKLFASDNHFNLSGYVFITFIFGSLFFGIQKLVNYLTEWNAKINYFFEQSSTM
jgi:hypothetical protein